MNTHASSTIKKRTNVKAKTLIVHPEKCTGCDACMYTCATAHWGTPARIHIAGDEAEGHFLPITCVGCPDRQCVTVCPEGAVKPSARINLPLINLEKCTGCGLCVKACPLGAIVLKGKKAYKCDLCGGSPDCAEACIPGAIRFEALNRDIAREKIRYLSKLVEQ
jgi:Fe-S-cluster-containing hydrogenase component 2